MSVHRESSKVSPMPDLPAASCRGLMPELFVSDESEGHEGSRFDARAAKRVCKECPERVPCLEYALDNPVLMGVWGGTTTKDRQAMRAEANREVA